MSKQQIPKTPPKKLISTPPAAQLGADWISCAAPIVQETFLSKLSPAELLALPWMFEFWALKHQIPPKGDWRSWVIMGGRGAGKTRAGAEWIRSMAEGARPTDAGTAKRIALVGETLDQAREIMVFGESGILACSPPDRRPQWRATRRQLHWKNGAVAQIFSAHDPESLRGPQFDCAWLDELAKWKKAQAVWDMLQFGLRLGKHPRQLITTTPRDCQTLKDILANRKTVITHAPTEANRAHLADSFLADVRQKFAGTQLGRQELDGILLESREGMLWKPEQFEPRVTADLSAFDRIVVAVDPPVSHHSASDECGIVVVGAITQGARHTWRATVLADCSFKPRSPVAWARKALQAMKEYNADRMIAEVNQGGDMVETIIRNIDPLVPFRALRASRGKTARAEPISALYEQSRITHTNGLHALEEQMCQFTLHGYQGTGSPDRVDALVWALYDLIISPPTQNFVPKMRRI